MREIVVGSEALRSGLLTRGQLSRQLRVLPDVRTTGSILPLRDRTLAAWLWSRRRAVIAGAAAAAPHGARWIDDDTPVGLILENGRPPKGLIVRNETLADAEVTRVAGLLVTTVPHRVRPGSPPAPGSRHRPSRRPQTGEPVLFGGRRGAGLPASGRAACADCGRPCHSTSTPGRVAEGDVAAPNHRRRPAHTDDTDTRSRHPGIGGGARYGLGGVQSRGRVRRRSTPARSAAIRVGSAPRPTSSRQRWHVVKVIREDRPAEVVSRIDGALRSRGWRPVTVMAPTRLT